MWNKIIVCSAVLVLMTACVSVKPKALFDEASSKPEPPHIENFYALNVLKDKLNSEVWFTPDVKCIQVANSAETLYAGNSAVHLKWDKIEGGCDWIGMGIGWDGWAPKDLSMIMNKAAIQFKAFSKDGKIVSLPLAAAMEDYGGKQAWIGFASKYITYNEGESWATVTLPIGDFGWEQFGADETNIKQMIIQFEAAGDVYFDEIRVVPFTGTLNKHCASRFDNDPGFVIDGELDEVSWSNSIEIEGNKISIVGNSEYLFVSGVIQDASPILNDKSGDDVWNGDGVELAFSTNEDANPKRKQLLLTDQHVCIKLGENPVVWDWQAHKIIANSNIAYKKTNSGYQFEAKIPYAHFNRGNLKSDINYHIEVAINDGNGKNRTKQLKWNSSGIEGFHKNPSLWGNITYEEQKSE